MSKVLGLKDQVLYVDATIQHLQYGRSTIDLAEELGISRFTVGRMIKRALEDGLVEVVPRLPEPVDSALSKVLAKKYGLSSAIVVTPPANSDESARIMVARLAARLVSELIDEDDIVGLGPGRTIVETCKLIVDVPTCDIVQLTGGATSEPEANLLAIMRLSRVAKGRMFPLYAPFLATDPASARAIAAQPAVRHALLRMDQLDKAVLTVGGWPHSSLLATHLEELGELESLLEHGVVAEFGTTLLDAEGREVKELEGRLIGVTTDQLAKVPVRVAIGGGPGKQEAVVAVLKSGLVDVVVTDERIARVAIDAT